MMPLGGGIDCILQHALEGRQARTVCPPYSYVHYCLEQNGQGKSVWWVGPMACLGSSFCVKRYLDFSFVFLSRPASLGHRSQITEGPVLSRFSYTKCTHARQIQCGQYCGPSSSRIVRNSTEHYLRCEESSSLG